MFQRFRFVRAPLLGVLLLALGCDSQSHPTAPEEPFFLGQSYGGGVIFFLDQTGVHGLIAAPNDQGDVLPWFNGAILETGATETGLGEGAGNTASIVAAQGEGTYAASVCDQLVLNGFDDWFLPSKAELEVLFANRALVGGLQDTFYWSSTEHGEGSAWEQSFGSGAQYYANKNFPIRVRAIRAF